MKILIVDDSEEFLSALQDTVEGLGHSVITANSHASGLNAFSQHRPEMVFTDLRMGGKGRAGLWLLLDIKDSDHPEVPVVIMSDDFPDGFTERVRQRGAKAVLEKSRMEPDLLKSLIED